MSIEDDDGDEPMDTNGMEPEAPMGDDGDPDDPSDPDGDNAIAAGGGISAIIHRNRGRAPISDAQRAKWRELAKGKQVAPEDDPEEQLLDQPPDTQAAAEKPQGAHATSPTLAAAPPAPSLDPEVTRLREEHTQRLAALDAREQALADREQSGDWGKLAADYAEKGAPAIIDVIKKLAGVTSDEDLKSEVADLITQLSASVLSVDVPQSVRDKIESKLARRSLHLTKEQLRKEAEERTKAAERERESQKVAHVRNILNSEVTKAQATYPWLAAEDNAGHIVYDVIDAQYKKDGTRLTWQDAAKRADDYLKTQASAWADKRKHLLGATSANAGTSKSGKQQAQQVRPSGTQVTAPKPTDTPAPEVQDKPYIVNGKYNAEAHRAYTKRKNRAAFAPDTD